jgi:hypothetical protein
VLYGQTLPPAPDYPGVKAGWYPLHPDKISNYGVPTKIEALCLHTPEEDADDVESTPRFFALPAAQSSSGGTQYYGDSDGDVIQMARDWQQVHAQGVRSSGANPNVRLPRPPWYRAERISYNTCMLSYEIEGRAATLHLTMKIGGPQWNSLVAWSAYKYRQYGLPVGEIEQRIIGHGSLSLDRTDPGPKFPWGEFYRQVRLRVQAGTPTQPAPTVPPSGSPHPTLTAAQISASAILINSPGMPPVAGIAAAKIENTGERSGSYEVHRLLIRRA